MARGRNVSSIEEIVKGIFASLEKGKGLIREDVELAWKKAVGEQGFKHSRPVSLRKKVLNVYVDSSAWLEELAMQKRVILKKLKVEFGRDQILEIRLKTGEF